jgi:glycosyltransferase A (GT-A) superfamily protein (DUF2064 family)
MHATENEDMSERQRVQERAPRRAIENVSLSDRSAGARVTEVVRHRLADGSQRVVVTNADRNVPRDLVDHAFEALRYSALVCAPDVNGAIALLGTTQPLDELLAEIAWDTHDALDELLRAARAQHVPVLLLPPTPGERVGSSAS